MEADEESDKKSDVQRQWIAAHAYLKIEFTEGDKRHNLMSRLIRNFIYVLLPKRLTYFYF